MVDYYSSTLTHTEGNFHVDDDDYDNYVNGDYVYDDYLIWCDVMA